MFHVWKVSAPDGRHLAVGPVDRFVLAHLAAGVVLFFALSGFLLYRPIVAAVVDGRALPDVRRYLGNRAKRILPAYWVILVVIGVVLPAALTHGPGGPKDLVLGRLTDDPQDLLTNATFTQNWFGGSMDTGIGPAWTLAIEVVFYLSLPVLGALALRLARRRGRAAPDLVAVAVPPLLLLATGWAARALKEALDADTVLHQVVNHSFFARADLFTLGMLLAVLWVAVDRGLVRLASRWRVYATACLVLLVPTISVLADRGELARWPVLNPYESLESVAAALVLALVVLPAPGSDWHLRFLSWRPVVAVGVASYSLFLWHEPVARVAAVHDITASGGYAAFAFNLLVVAAIAAALSAITYTFVEAPFLRSRDSLPTDGGSDARSGVATAPVPTVATTPAVRN